MTLPDKTDSPQRILATRIVADIMNLELLGRWPQGERADWVVWSLDHHASVEQIARALGCTREHVRQINNRERRLRDRGRAR